jgi:hypothetical protein
MTTTVNPESIEIVSEVRPTNSRKREIAASITAGVVTVSLGLVATGMIEKVAGIVRNRIAPKPEDEDE